MHALGVHDAVGVVDPRSERADGDLRLSGPPGLGRIEPVADLHRRDVAGILHRRRVAVDPERALLERHARGACRVGGRGGGGGLRRGGARLGGRRAADPDLHVGGVRVLVPVAAGREVDVDAGADGDALHIGLHLLARVVEDEPLAGDGVLRLLVGEHSAEAGLLEPLQVDAQLRARRDAGLERHRHLERPAGRPGLGGVDRAPVELGRLRGGGERGRGEQRDGEASNERGRRLAAIGMEGNRIIHGGSWMGSWDGEPRFAGRKYYDEPPCAVNAPIRPADLPVLAK